MCYVLSIRKNKKNIILNAKINVNHKKIVVHFWITGEIQKLFLEMYNEGGNDRRYVFRFYCSYNSSNT